MRPALVLLFCLLPLVAQAQREQSVDVSAVTAEVTETRTREVRIGEQVLSTETSRDVVGEHVVMKVTVASDNPLVRAYLKTRPFPPVALTRYEGDGEGVFLLYGDPGSEWTIEILAFDESGWMAPVYVPVVFPGELPPDPEPDPELEPEPEPDDEYVGPNEYGLGQLSYDLAPKYNADVVDTFRRAADYVTGVPEVKVIWIDDPEKNRTDYNVIIWCKNRMTEIAPGGDWAQWYNACMDRAKELHREGLTVQQWYEVFNEIAAGVEARK